MMMVVVAGRDGVIAVGVVVVVAACFSTVSAFSFAMPTINLPRPEIDQPVWECPMLKCVANCPNGYETNSHGCRTCTCKSSDVTIGTEAPQIACAAVRCKMYCRHRYKTDSNGCQTCQCKQPADTTTAEAPKPVCGPVRCRMYCKDGYETDSNGCQTCQCKQPTEVTSTEAPPAPTKCMKVMCFAPCRYGVIPDENGCENCNCRPAPTPAVDPNPEVDPFPEVDPESEDSFIEDAPAVEPTMTPCRPVRCRMFCMNGWEKDSNGCDICQCKQPPSTAAPSTHNVQIDDLTTIPDTCSLLPVVGPCRAMHRRFFYNSTSGQCQKFIYGGCLGNANNFETLELCQSKCDPVTEDPLIFVDPAPEPTMTPCRPIRCKMFCMNGWEKDSNGCDICKCKQPPSTAAPSTPRIIVDYFSTTDVVPPEPRSGSGSRCSEAMCLLLCDDGFDTDSNGCPICRCRESATIPAVTTEPSIPEKPRCGPVCFIFCEHGNVLDENGCPICECKPSPNTPNTDRAITTTETTARCFLKRETGPCRGSFQRYFYNSNSGQCESFIYGGCRGNENNFETLQDCQSTCGVTTTPESTTAPITHHDYFSSPVTPMCGPVCFIFCEYGNVLDDNGCPICECKQAPDTSTAEAEPEINYQCPQVRCSTYCPGGYQEDWRGCLTCTCKGVMTTIPTTDIVYEEPKKEELTWMCVLKSLDCNSLYTTYLSNAAQWVQSQDKQSLSKACSSVRGRLTTCMKDAMVECSGSSLYTKNLFQLKNMLETTCRVTESQSCEERALSCMSEVSAMPDWKRQGIVSSDTLRALCTLHKEMVTCLKSLSGECQQLELVRNITSTAQQTLASCNEPNRGKPACAPLMCTIYCPHGIAHDDFGCPRCECRLAPNIVFDSPECGRTECYDLDCPHGFVRQGPNDCPVCKCLPRSGARNQHFMRPAA